MKEGSKRMMTPHTYHEAGVTSYAYFKNHILICAHDKKKELVFTAALTDRYVFFYPHEMCNECGMLFHVDFNAMNGGEGTAVRTSAAPNEGWWNREN